MEWILIDKNNLPVGDVLLRSKYGSPFVGVVYIGDYGNIYSSHGEDSDINVTHYFRWQELKEPQDKKLLESK